MSTIHPTALVADGANLGSNVSVGPYCVIGPGVTLADDVVLHSHVVIEGNTTVHTACQIFPFASIGMQSQDRKFHGAHTTVEIGPRTILREYVTVNSGTNEGEVTHVGSDCLIMAYCHVAHACRVGNDVVMANGATLAGDVEVEDQAVIGGLTGVHQFCRIGRLCMVGGCTKVVKDLPPFMMVDGHPAVVRGINKIGLERRGVSEEDRRTLKTAYRIFYRENRSVRQALEHIRSTLQMSDTLEHWLTFIESSQRGITK